MAARLTLAPALSAVFFLAATGVEHASGSPAGEPVVMPEGQAIDRFRLRERLESYRERSARTAPSRVVEVVEGDLHIAGDLLLDASAARKRVEAIRPRGPGDRLAVTAPGAVGLIVTGRLTVEGAIINADLNHGPFLYVLGETRARAMFAGGAEFRFDRLARFADAVVGCYNDGVVRFAGGVESPFVISEDHSFDILGERSPYADYFNDDGDVSLLRTRLHPTLAGIDFSELDAEAVLLPRIRRAEPIVAAAK